MKLHLNGEEKEITGASSVAELVAALGLPAETALVEHNGVALHRSEWAGRTLSEGDQLEILRIAAGG